MGNACCGNSQNQTGDIPNKTKGRTHKDQRRKNANEMRIGVIDEQELLKPIAKQRAIETPRGTNDKHYVSSSVNFLLQGQDPEVYAK